MRSLQAVDNTDAATSDYPYRKVRDTLAEVDGTKLWERVFSDLIHGVQKLIRLVGLTPNDLADNETNGYQILDALELHGQARVFNVSWNNVSGDIYAESTDIDALTVGKTYKFKSDKNLLPSDGIYLKIDGTDYTIDFQGCNFILSNQTFNVFVNSSSTVIVTNVGNVNEFVGSSFNSFAYYSDISSIAGVCKYKNRYYVASLGNDKVYVYDSEGILKLTFGVSGSGSGELDSPRGIAVVNDRIFVCDYNNSRVNVYSLTGSFIFSFNGGSMLQPVKIVSSEETGMVYVVDSNSQDNAKAYTIGSGLYQFTLGNNETFADIAVFKGLVYLLFYVSGFDSSIRRYNGNTGAVDNNFGRYDFETAKNVSKLFAVNDDFLILGSPNKVSLVDKNYESNAASYVDILKEIVSDYSFTDGGIDGKELYFANNDFYDGRRSIYKFL